MTANSFRCLCLAIASVLFLTASASAQTVQGQVTVDGAIIWRSDVAAPFATAPAGTALEVTAQSTRWYEVIVPEPLGGRDGARGLISRSQLRIAGDPAAIPTRALRGDTATAAPRGPNRAGAPPRAAPAVRQTGNRRRQPVQTLLFVNGVLQTASTDFTDTFSFQENAEQARIDTTYTVKSMRGFSGGIAVMPSPRFGIGVSVERSTTSTPAVLNGTIPHPFFFGAGRSIEAQISGLDREELALHGEIRATWPVGNRLQLSALGGPSLFRVSQAIASDVTYADEYPFDVARFVGSESLTATKNRLGFNVGGEAAFFFSRAVGIGARVTLSRATFRLPLGDGHEAELEAGGVRAGAGLRLRF